MERLHRPTSAEYLLAHPNDRNRLLVQFELYHEHFCRSFDRALVRAKVVPPGAWRALNVAYGEKLYCADLIDRFANATVVGFDRDPEAIATALMAFSSRPRLSFHVADAHDALRPVVGEGFDVAFAQMGLTHFKSGAIALRRIHEVMRPGGAIMLLDATEGCFVHPHPGGAPLAEAMRSAWRGFGTFAAGDRHVQLLTEAGFADVISEAQDYKMGGPTLQGKACLTNMIELLSSMRNSLVERARVISAPDFDTHLAGLRASGEDSEGVCWYRMSIAVKPP
jgi:SAM-dependent methyltransferase